MKFLIFILVLVMGVQGERKSFGIDDIEDFSAYIESQPLRHIKRVLICSNEDALQQIMEHWLNMFRVFSLFPNMDIEFLDVTHCPDEIESDGHGERSILAVMAPKPFANLSDTKVPIYFYEAPYFLEDLDAHSNNIPALVDWRPLKHAFTHFFEQQGWLRIAIVSDDSPYSAAFEEEMVGHLNEQQLVYNVQRCVETKKHRNNCDFHEALKFIKENKAFIVVANVAVKNALSLAKQARAHGVTRKYGFIWLTRDWPFGSISKHELYGMGPIISLTLAPLMKDTVRHQFRSKVLDGPHLVSILQGLSLIDDAVRHTKRNRIDYFYRDIAKHMNRAIRRNTYDTQAFIRKIDVDLSEISSTVITIVVANSQSITSYSIINDFTPRVYDLIGCTMMRSNVFLDPCNDFWISGIVLVVLLFILMFLLIIYVYIRFFCIL